MCLNQRLGDGERGPVVLVYNIPDKNSKVGAWKTVTIDCECYDEAFLRTIRLPRICWGHIIKDDGEIVKFGVEER